MTFLYPFHSTSYRFCIKIHKCSILSHFLTASSSWYKPWQLVYTTCIWKSSLFASRYLRAWYNWTEKSLIISSSMLLRTALFTKTKIFCINANSNSIVRSEMKLADCYVRNSSTIAINNSFCKKTDSTEFGSTVKLHHGSSHSSSSKISVSHCPLKTKIMLVTVVSLLDVRHIKQDFLGRLFDYVNILCTFVIKLKC